MEDVVDVLIIMLERALNKKGMELSLEDMDKLRDVLDEILANKEIE